MYSKDFDGWNKLKQIIDERPADVFAYPREIWWCSLGVNIGAEMNGKNDNFERPVVIVKVYNKETLLALPLTSKPKTDKFHFRISSGQHDSWAKLTQAKVLSHKRLLRKIDVLNEMEFSQLVLAWKNFV